MTLAAAVADAAARHADAPALVTEHDRAVSFRELDRASDEVAAGLAARGVGRGDVVALALPSGIAYVVAYAAAAKLGAATAGVNPGLSPVERATLVDVAGPRLVLATPELATGLPPDAPVELVTADDDAGLVLPELALAGGAPPALVPDPDALVALVFTSGTTGTPKAAEFTGRQLAAITAADVGDRSDGGGPVLASTQMAHVGFTTKLPWYLRVGSRLCLLDRWRPEAVLAAVERHRMTSVGGVAPQLALLLRSEAMDRYDVSSVATIVMGGGPSPPALVEEARRRFDAAYSIRYSSTESGGVGTGTAFDADDEEALHTVGRPRAGVEVRIVGGDEDPGHERPGEDGIGEVAIRSACTMRGYRGAPEATARVLRDGWLHTGDLGRIDERGLLRLAGRADDIYIRGGYNVHPLEVEAVLGGHPAVAEVVVVPRPDEVLGQVGVAVVVPRPGVPDPALGDLRAASADRLARWKLPEDLHVVEAIPRTAMGKVDRRALAALVATAAPSDHPA